MNRREFGKTASIVAATAAVAPAIIAEPVPTAPPWDEIAYLKECGVPAEQVDAIVKAGNGGVPAQIFYDVAKSIPSQIEDSGWTPKGGWGHGACRSVPMIGGYTIQAFEQRTVPVNVDLSDIGYVGFYRQAVRNKHTGEIRFFAVTIPLGNGGEVKPGESMDTGGKMIPFGWKRNEVEAMARESFLKLQEWVVGFHNREA